MSFIPTLLDCFGSFDDRKSFSSTATGMVAGGGLVCLVLMSFMPLFTDLDLIQP